MGGFNQKEYQTVVLAALLHVVRSQLVGEVEKFTNKGERNNYGRYNI